MIMIYSATNVMAGSSIRYGFDPAYFFKRQVLFLAIGIAFAMCLSRVDHDVYRRQIGWIVGTAFLLLLLVYVPRVGHAANGASRWINLRLFTFQPSEFAKFALLAFAAWAIDRNGENPKKGYRAFLPMLAVMGLFVAVILKEPDFGMAVVIIARLVVSNSSRVHSKILAGLLSAPALRGRRYPTGQAVRVARTRRSRPDLPGPVRPDTRS